MYMVLQVKNTNTALHICHIQFSPWKGSQIVAISSLCYPKQKLMYMRRQITAFWETT